MLNKRTHILFDQETFDTLATIAKEQNTSIGNLVRKAVKKNYAESKNSRIKRNLKAFEEIKKWQKEIGVAKGRINYKELIEDGRRF